MQMRIKGKKIRGLKKENNSNVFLLSGATWQYSLQVQKRNKLF